MHEFALAKNLLNAVLHEAQLNKINKICSIKVVIGEMTAALPEALKFSFEALSRDTPAEGAELIMEKFPLQLKCQDCGTVFAPRELNFTCLNCQSRFTEIARGRELFIEYFEGE